MVIASHKHTPILTPWLNTKLLVDQLLNIVKLSLMYIIDPTFLLKSKRGLNICLTVWS